MLSSIAWRRRCSKPTRYWFLSLRFLKSLLNTQFMHNNSKLNSTSSVYALLLSCMHVVLQWHLHEADPHQIRDISAKHYKRRNMENMRHYTDSSPTWTISLKFLKCHEMTANVHQLHAAMAVPAERKAGIAPRVGLGYYCISMSLDVVSLVYEQQEVPNPIVPRAMFLVRRGWATLDYFPRASPYNPWDF